MPELVSGKREDEHEPDNRVQQHHDLVRDAEREQVESPVTASKVSRPTTKTTSPYRHALAFGWVLGKDVISPIGIRRSKEPSGNLSTDWHAPCEATSIRYGAMLIQ